MTRLMNEWKYKNSNVYIFVVIRTTHCAKKICEELKVL